MNTWLISASVALAIVSTGAHAAGDASAGQAKAAACVACHGPDGNSPNPIWPKLAGQHPEYLNKQLMNFKAGERQNELMMPQVAPLNEQDMQNIAAYFASLKQSSGTANPAAVEQGEKIYRGGNPATGLPACTGCHGPAGSGLGLAKFPRIGGQHAQYMESTLKDFRAGKRANDPNGMMRGVAARMTDAEIAAVVQYTQGLTD
jgi:cytochrome c553